ncbi:hypothetical protein [Dyella terrae]|uniref:hypothetical protein n=1 Tax=Dyella terrae TaxID=522259 RepID=UPI001EFC8B22|nr:hypothetical protein [Dyella terrae]ULU26792.1 hypothetical protein DYST_03740 [Dyella terrae]
MTSYQRIATLIFRLAGTTWTVFLAFIWSLYFAEMALGVEVQRYPTHTIIGNAGYVAFGVLVIVFSKPLGRLVARGLE